MNVTSLSVRKEVTRVIPTEDLQSLVRGGLAAEEARYDLRLLGPSEIRAVHARQRSLYQAVQEVGQWKHKEKITSYRLF